jgi:predicted phage baseplate assembly protein
LLVAAFTREPGHERYSDHTAVATGTLDGAFTAFQGSRPIEHHLYLGHQGLFGLATTKDITLRFVLAEGDEPWLSLIEWASWDGFQWEALPTAGPPGQVSGGWEITLPNVLGIPHTPVADRMSAWLRGRLTSALSASQPMPRIDTIMSRVLIRGLARTPELIFTNQLPVDPGKDFFPFGEKPKFNDTLYLASDEAFSKANADIALTIALTNPADERETPLPAQPSDDRLTLSWEFWNGQQWDLLGESGPGAQQPPKYNFRDGTEAFTTGAATARQVTFSCPAELRPIQINGQLRHWIRVRILRGDYGREAEYRLRNPQNPNEGYIFVPATFRPPSIKAITLSYAYTSPFTPLDLTLSINDFAIVDHSQEAKTPGKMFNPYTATSDTHPTLYLGFQRLGADIGFANRATVLYFSVAAALYGETPDSGQVVVEPPSVVWEYWNGSRWARLGTRDETQGFSRRGLVTFIGPPDFRMSTEFGWPAFWLRARWERGAYPQPPQLQRILTNTTWASQTLAVQNEVLGSSNGQPDQGFRTSKAPVLDGQRLEIREPETPSAGERVALEREEGDDAIALRLDAGGRPMEVWVRWHQVSDFYASEPRSRHYTLDRLSGEVRFGDGTRGLVPPQGRGNVRMAWYQTGGGPEGNRPPGSITQLKRAVPYVDTVTNHETSSGGSAQESLEMVQERGPKVLRHRDRAVAIADFEDLAFQSSSEVARVKAIPTRSHNDAGGVGLIIVPRSVDPQPIPSRQLLHLVEDYIGARFAPTVDLWVAGPDWLRVTVTAEVVPLSLEVATDVQAAVLARLAAFLHPLTGGLDGKGWAFGRKPYRSDLHALIESTLGVDYVLSLAVAEMADDDLQPDRFLVYARGHHITMVSGTES